MNIKNIEKKIQNNLEQVELNKDIEKDQEVLLEFDLDLHDLEGLLVEDL